jgi:hypothetical protein
VSREQEFKSLAHCAVLLPFRRNCVAQLFARAFPAFLPS